jgi:hypothetical protein
MANSDITNSKEWKLTTEPAVLDNKITSNISIEHSDEFCSTLVERCFGGTDPCLCIEVVTKSKGLNDQVLEHFTNTTIPIKVLEDIINAIKNANIQECNYDIKKIKV